MYSQSWKNLNFRDSKWRTWPENGVLKGGSTSRDLTPSRLTRLVCPFFQSPFNKRFIKIVNKMYTYFNSSIFYIPYGRSWVQYRKISWYVNKRCVCLQNESAVRTAMYMLSEFTKPFYTKLGTETSHLLLRL